MAAPILWAPTMSVFFLQEKLHVHKIKKKILVLGGGGGGYFGFGGGGSADFILMGAGISLINWESTRNRARTPPDRWPLPSQTASQDPVARSCGFLAPDLKAKTEVGSNPTF